jgi:hypothetical protein
VRHGAKPFGTDETRGETAAKRAIATSDASETPAREGMAMDEEHHATAEWLRRLRRWVGRIGYRPERRYMRGGRAA